MSPYADRETLIASKADCAHQGCKTKGYFKTDYCFKHRSVMCVDCSEMFSPNILGNRRCNACTSNMKQKMNKLGEFNV
jgi:hypothetical protein